MKRATSLTPPSTGLSGILFPTLKSIGDIDLERPEKYNNGATFYGIKAHLYNHFNKVAIEYKYNAVM